MRKTYRLEDLDCANCAAKMENAIRAIPGVTYASVVFMTQKLVLEAEDDRFDEALAQARKAIAKVEPDCHILG